jgi:glycosyltransferase involved in cell wall biosynthesis
MRLLLGLDTWGLVGGSERYAGAVSEELAARGHEVVVLCARREGPALGAAEVVELAAYGQREGSAGQVAARAAALRPDAILVLSCASPAAFEELLSVAPTVRFVQDHTPFCPGLNKLHADGSACQRPQGRACIEHFVGRGGCQGFRRDEHRPHAFAAWFALRKHQRALRMAASCERLLVASEFMRRELIAAGVEPERVALVPYFTLSNSPRLPAGGMDAPTASFVARGTAPLLFAAARLVPEKGIDRFVAALAALRTPVRAVIAGSGPVEDELKRQAHDAGLDARVHFAGWQSAGAIERLYAAASAVVFPSVWDEPFGLVGLEAMAHGKPVAAFDVGGVREWLADGVTGLLAPRGDVVHLAAALDELASNRERASALGTAGRARAERQFSIEPGIAALERELMRAARAGRRSAA